MTYKAVQIARFGGPDVLELTDLPGPPIPGPDEVRIKVQAAGTGFTDTFIRRGRYPGVKGPLPLTLGYELVGTIDAIGPGVTDLSIGQLVADLCVTGGYAQFAIRPGRSVVPVPSGVDPAYAVCIPLAYTTAYQMLVRMRPLPPGATVLVVGASGTVGTALLDLARQKGLRAIGTCSGRNRHVVEERGAIAVDYVEEDFVAAVRRLTAGNGVDAAFDAIGGAHFARSFACLAKGGLLVAYGSQTLAVGRESMLAAGLGLARLKLWEAAPMLFGRRSATFYAITARRVARPDEFRMDVAALFKMLQDGAINPTVIERLPLAAAREAHERIERGGLGGKIVLLPEESD